MKSSASESKPFQNRSKGEIPGRTRRKEQLSRSKLKQAFLIDSDAELFMYLIQCISSASELGLITVEPRFNEPLYSKVLGMINDVLQPGQNYKINIKCI